MQRIFILLRRFAESQHLVAILQKVLIYLNCPEPTSIVQSNLSRLVFFNQQTIVNYNKLDAHFHELKNLKILPTPIKRLIILDFQNTPQSVLDEIEDHFEEMDFRVHLYKNMTSTQTSNLFSEGKLQLDCV